MKALLVCSLVALAPLALGCGTIEYDRDPAYPQSVGYTPPDQQQVAPPPAPEQVAQQQEPQGNDVGAPVQAPQGQDVAIGAPSGDEYADTDPSALTDFRSTLDPYGSWVDDGTYGTVWVPSSTVVGDDFQPYVSAGHWTYDTDYVWVSDYSWGWAPFHYGRWVYIGGRGWGWIPGRVYSGAWVSWRVGYGDWGYVGWGPMAPTWYWHHGYAYGVAVTPYVPYAFCAHGDLFHAHVGGRIVTGTQVGVVAGHTRPYVPASPTVGAGGHVPARPSVGGPAPSGLGISSHPAPPTGDRGLAQARAYAHPSTAQPLGARPPAQAMAHNGAPNVGNAGPHTGAPQGVARGTGPAQGSPYSHTPPTSGYRPSTPGYRPPATSSPYAGRPSTPYYGSTPHYAPSTPHYAPSAPHYAPSTPHYAPSAPHYAPSAPSGGTYHAPSGGGGYHSSGGGGYHPSGGGGYHGGGGGRGGRR
jgi:hypothetical protein